MSEYYFLASAGPERLNSRHTDGVHIFFDMDWDEFRPALRNPHDWLIERIEEPRHRHIQEDLDLLIVPLKSGFTVDYPEDGRVVTLGIGPYQHKPTTLMTVAEKIRANLVKDKIETKVVETRIPSQDFISRHVELGTFDIWEEIAPVLLQSTNRLFDVMMASRTGGPLFDLDRQDMGSTDGFPEMRINPDQRYTHFVQLSTRCSQAGESESACQSNYPGWDHVGSGSTKKYCR